MTPQRANFDAIIVHYHAARLVREAVDALKRDGRASGLTVRVIVSDNGSTPEERALLQSLDADYIATGRDAGYSGAINCAFPLTTADAIIVMNEDVQVIPGCLRTLLDALHDGADAVGPEFYWDREKVFVLPSTEERTRRNELMKVAAKRRPAAMDRARHAWRAHMRRHWRGGSPFLSTSLSGALIAFLRATWNAVGPFDEDYHMYFDENDWLNRVEQAGLKPMYVSEAKAFHLHNPKLTLDADRAQWAADSFVRFGNRYYGERFVRRLRCFDRIAPQLPTWETLPTDGRTVEFEIPPGDYAWPLWVEITVTPLGFPAAAARITDPATTRWRLPVMKGLYFPQGTYYMQLVDDDGHEIRRFAFEGGAS